MTTIGSCPECSAAAWPPTQQAREEHSSCSKAGIDAGRPPSANSWSSIFPRAGYAAASIASAAASHAIYVCHCFRCSCKCPSAAQTPAELWSFPDRTTAVGDMIDTYLSSKQDLDDAAIHLLFSANRWEKQ